MLVQNEPKTLADAGAIVFFFLSTCRRKKEEIWGKRGKKRKFGGNEGKRGNLGERGNLGAGGARRRKLGAEGAREEENWAPKAPGRKF